jgi:hypothetical protein
MQTLLITHIGSRWPHYLKDCIHQARLINPVEEVELVLLVNQCHKEAVQNLVEQYKITPCYIETLITTESYKQFMQYIPSLVDSSFRSNYWQYVLERFFLLESYLTQETAKNNVYMIETDNLVYVPLKYIKETEALFSQDMALPFDSLERGYPSFMFFRRLQSVRNFTQFILACLKQGLTSDMEMLGWYRRMNPERVFSYPVLPHSCNSPLKVRRSTSDKHVAPAKETAFLSNEQFPFVFDAIAYGQFVGGIDPCNIGGQVSVGFKNESALYTVDEMELGWAQHNGAWLLLANRIPVVNLHIHSKALHCFLSDQPTVPQGSYNPKELEKILTNEFTYSSS